MTGLLPKSGEQNGEKGDDSRRLYGRFGIHGIGLIGCFMSKPSDVYCTNVNPAAHISFTRCQGRCVALFTRQPSS